MLQMDVFIHEAKDPGIFFCSPKDKVNKTRCSGFYVSEDPNPRSRGAEYSNVMQPESTLSL